MSGGDPAWVPSPGRGRARRFGVMLGRWGIILVMVCLPALVLGAFVYLSSLSADPDPCPVLGGGSRQSVNQRLDDLFPLPADEEDLTGYLLSHGFTLLDDRQAEWKGFSGSCPAHCVVIWDVDPAATQVIRHSGTAIASCG